MSQTIAYIRASTDKQDIQNQRHEILEHANKNDLKIGDWIEATVSSRKTSKQRRIDELMERLVRQCHIRFAVFWASNARI